MHLLVCTAPEGAHSRLGSGRHLRRNLRTGSSGGRRTSMSPLLRMSHLDLSPPRKSCCLNCQDFVLETKGIERTPRLIRGLAESGGLACSG